MMQLIKKKRYTEAKATSLRGEKGRDIENKRGMSLRVGS